MGKLSDGTPTYRRIASESHFSGCSAPPRSIPFPTYPNMKTESLKFPLHAELHIRLPKGARITGVTVTDDITFLTLESADDVPPLSGVQRMTMNTYVHEGIIVEMEEHTIYTFLEGEKKGEDLILIPEEGANLRKLGVVNIVDPESTFHVFEKIQ